MRDCGMVASARVTIHQSPITIHIAFPGTRGHNERACPHSLSAHLPPLSQQRAVGGEYGDGTPVSLAGFRGRIVVLYFYPKDDTPGCTQQACELRDAWTQLAKRAAVFGVSIDSAKRHAKFIAKYALPFPLLADESHALVTAYEVWVEKSLYGRKYMGAERSTFIIGPDGKIAAILRKVKPAAHAGELLATLDSLKH